MMRGPPPGYGPRGYDPRGVYVPRDPREYEPRRHQGPSPWIPATILGVILIITAMPYTRSISAPDPMLAYQAAAAAAAAASRPSYNFPLPLLWIPVLAVIAFQFFGGGNWYDPDAYRFGMRGRGGYPGRPGAYPAMAPGAYRNRGLEPNRGWGAGWWPWSTPSWDANSRYNNVNQQRGLLSLFMDYGGHWVLILLGIALFTLVGASSSVLPSAVLPLPPAVLPIPPLAPQTLGFPWSLFF